MNRYRWFHVTLNGKRVDSIHQLIAPGASLKETAEDVRRSLVNHDGYDPGIKVRAERGWKTPDGKFLVTR